MTKKAETIPYNGKTRGGTREEGENPSISPELRIISRRVQELIDQEEDRITRTIGVWLERELP